MKKYTWTDGSIYYDELPGIMDNTSPVTEAWWLAHGGTSETVPDPPSPSTTVTWGGISGTLSNQTDLDNALSAKQDVIDASHKLDYDLISNTPTIGSGALTISVGGSAVVFNANQTSDSTVEIPGGISAVSWGEISGALANQTDLSAALALKANTTAIGSGTLTFTSGGATVATFNANQTTDTTVVLPEGGSGGTGIIYSSGMAHYSMSSAVDVNWPAAKLLVTSVYILPTANRVIAEFYRDRDLNTVYYSYGGTLYVCTKQPLYDGVCVYNVTPDYANGVYGLSEGKYVRTTSSGQNMELRSTDGGPWMLWEITSASDPGDAPVWVQLAYNAELDGSGVVGTNHIAKYVGMGETDDVYVADFLLEIDELIPTDWGDADRMYRYMFGSSIPYWNTYFEKMTAAMYYQAYRHPYDAFMHICNSWELIDSSTLTVEFGHAYIWYPQGNGALKVGIQTGSGGLFDTYNWPKGLPRGYTGRIHILIRFVEPNTIFTASNFIVMGELKPNIWNVCEILYPAAFDLSTTVTCALVVYNSMGDGGAIDTIELNGSALAITSKTVDITALTGITLNGSASGVTITSGIADLTVTGGGGEVNVIDSIYYGESSATVTNKAAQLSGIIHIPTVGSANLIFTSGGTQLTSFNANATTDVTVALPEGGASPAITVIPAATTAYTLSEGQFTHIPESAPTYTLPNITDNTHAHEVLLDVKFDNVQTLVFHDYSGNLVTPQDQTDIQQGELWRFLCQWNTVLTCWCIMPMKLTDNTVYAPVLSISPSTYTVSGNQDAALTPLDLSSNVTIQHPVTGVSPVFSSLNLPAGVTITSAGVISGTPTAQGVTSSTVSIAYTGATSITCTVVFTIAAPPVTYYYTVSGATATPDANGDYYVHSGTHGSPGVVYTNGAFYMFDANDCWVINNAPEWDPEGLGPLFGSILHSAEGSYATVPTGTWTNGMDMPTDEATVSAYGA